MSASAMQGHLAAWSVISDLWAFPIVPILLGSRYIPTNFDF